jgi:Tn3 transposase DDE domain
MGSPTHLENWASSSAQSLRWTGCRTRICAGAAMSDSTKANSRMRYGGLCSSIASGKSAIGLYENQRYRASGLVVAAIILWNTTYLQRAVDHLRSLGIKPTPEDLRHLSPLGWEHINLTGDYHWKLIRPSDRINFGRCEPDQSTSLWRPRVRNIPFRVFPQRCCDEHAAASRSPHPSGEDRLGSLPLCSGPGIPASSAGAKLARATSVLRP